MTDELVNAHIEINPTTKAVTVTLDKATIYTITPDRYGLTVAVGCIKTDGTPGETQLGLSCVDRVTVHIDAL